MTRYLVALERSLPYLSARKRDELAFIMEVLFEEFRLTQRPKAGEKAPRGRILKLILFGAHARGSRVGDNKGRSFADYDILAVVNDHASADPELWYPVENRLDREYFFTKRLKAPVELIIHSYADISKELSVSRPFFVDIVRNGVMLYEEDGFPLTVSVRMPKEQRHKEAQKNFDKWYQKSLVSLKGAKAYFKDAQTEKNLETKNTLMNDAAFLAHQATERIYNCVLLTLTLYTPKLHNLEKLRSFAHVVASDLEGIWPRNRKVYKSNFELLRRAYVEARYSPHYEITNEQLQWLFGRIEALQNKVREICEAHLHETA